MYYIYINSNATAINGERGFIKECLKPCIKRKGKMFYSVYTTTEFIFAKEFKVYDDANKYNKKYKLPGIIFERVDLYYEL